MKPSRGFMEARSRRNDALRRCATALAAVLLAACGSSAAVSAQAGTGAVSTAPTTSATPPRGAFRIDVHSHLLPAFYYASLAEHGLLTGGGGIPNPMWTPELALAFMDAYGIKTQIVSVSEPGVYYLPTEQERVDMATRINNYISHNLIGSPVFGDRFGGFAVLPLGDLSTQNVADAQAEASRAINTLGLDGVGLYTSYNNVYLGDSRFDPLLETLNGLGATVFVHPVTPAVNPDTGIPAFLTEFTFETTRAATKMLYAGVYQRYPRIHWILAHAGGTVPFTSYRTGLLTLVPALAQNLQNLGLKLDPPSAYGSLYYDTALSQARPAMAATRAVTDTSHILFGTDWPFSDIIFLVPGDPAPQLADSFDADELLLVERSNALALFPRVAARQ